MKYVILDQEAGLIILLCVRVRACMHVRHSVTASTVKVVNCIRKFRSWNSHQDQ